MSADWGAKPRISTLDKTLNNRKDIGTSYIKRRRGRDTVLGKSGVELIQILHHKKGGNVEWIVKIWISGQSMLLCMQLLLLKQ